MLILVPNDIFEIWFEIRKYHENNAIRSYVTDFLRFRMCDQKL